MTTAHDSCCYRCEHYTHPSPVPQWCWECQGHSFFRFTKATSHSSGAANAIVACTKHQDEMRAQVAAITAERDALRAGLEWLHERTVGVYDFGPVNGATEPVWGAFTRLYQPRADFWANLAAACGQPAIARLGAEEDTT